MKLADMRSTVIKQLESVEEIAALIIYALFYVACLAIIIIANLFD